jgi:hypothetical protein
MIKTLTLAAVLAAAFAPAAHAETLHKGQCYVSVNGQVGLDGACMYSLSKDGSFSFQTPGKAIGTFGGLDMNADGTGNGHWNGGHNEYQGNSSLGDNMTRSGGCWISTGDINGKLCVWAPGTRPANF